MGKSPQAGERGEYVCRLERVNEFQYERGYESWSARCGERADQQLASTRVRRELNVGRGRRREEERGIEEDKRLGRAVWRRRDAVCGCVSLVFSV